MRSRPEETKASPSLPAWILRCSDAIDAALARFVRTKLAGVPAPLLAVLAMLTVNFCLTLLDPRPPGADDREQLAHASQWALGYSGVQPPLHTWIVLAWESIVGDGIVAVMAARFSVLGVLFVVLDAVSRSLGLKDAARAAGTLGALLLPQIGWEAQRTFSHSLSALLFSTLAVLLFLMLLSRDSWKVWADLGAASAAAVLAKYNSVVVLAAASIGFVFMAWTGRAVPVVKRHVAIAVLVAAAVLALPATWLLGHLHTLDDSAHKFAFDDAGPATVLFGLASFFGAVVAYCCVLAGVAGVGLYAASGTVASVRARLRAVSLPVGAACLAITIGLVLAACSVLVLVSGATEFRVYWLHPALILLPPLVALVLDRADRSGWANRFVVAAALLAGAATTLAFVLRIFGIG